MSEKVFSSRGGSVWYMRRNAPTVFIARAIARLVENKLRPTSPVFIILSSSGEGRESVAETAAAGGSLPLAAGVGAADVAADSEPLRDTIPILSNALQVAPYNLTRNGKCWGVARCGVASIARIQKFKNGRTRRANAPSNVISGSASIKVQAAALKIMKYKRSRATRGRAEITSCAAA
jgi:hypothetical protein